MTKVEAAVPDENGDFVNNVLEITDLIKIRLHGRSSYKRCLKFYKVKIFDINYVHIGMHHIYTIRPHKVDLQFIISTFPIFQAGGQSLFIIHYLIIAKINNEPRHSIRRCGLHNSKFKGHVWTLILSRSQQVYRLACQIFILFWTQLR